MYAFLLDKSSISGLNEIYPVNRDLDLIHTRGDVKWRRLRKEL
ncbi:MAG: hypothetical protein SCAL_000067 [Candidatus Syntrophoarchaeum caldarius]|uniref:Uncharacterized protein n=1 Tax=Candidatus Syntropharchaeum caldarium TaxID=1838285 RepID=A0A1F2PCH8_9EURY|nr:MAG: hypothetical protein SCAL_000067 [Candidatus Syntrophoarchaeum caldarius]